MSNVIWSHDVNADAKIPVPIVKEWLESNGVTDGRTQRFEVLDDGTLRWWQLDEAGIANCECCSFENRDHDVPYLEWWHAHHLQGPFVTPLLVPLLPAMEPYGQRAA